MNDLYKVLTISEWENAKQNRFIETSLDIKDGFVPVSYTHLTLPTTLCV